MLTIPNNQVTVVILGNMQDGGLPHAGCTCARCAAAYADPSQAQYAACLALVDRREGQTAVWLIDATPDIKHQLHLLAGVLGPHPTRPDRFNQPHGIFLTHAHMGHVGGLPQLGPEAMAVTDLPVYGTDELCQLIAEAPLWSPLVERLDLRPMAPGASVWLAPRLRVTAVSVPHRDEWSVGTLAFHVEGPQKTLLYLPDIDAWDQWPAAEETLAAVDVALVDATFYGRDELGGRDPVVHPLVPDTLDRFAGLPGQLVLTHFNHTNPVLDEGSAVRAVVTAVGAQVAQTGQQFVL